MNDMPIEIKDAWRMKADAALRECRERLERINQMSKTGSILDAHHVQQMESIILDCQFILARERMA